VKIWPFSRSESSTSYGATISIFFFSLIVFVEVFIYLLFWPPALQYWLIILSLDLVIYFVSSIFLFQFLGEPLIQLVNRVKHTSITLEPVRTIGLRGEFGEILRDVDRLAETLNRERGGLLETYGEYRNIVESLEEGIMMIDSENRIIMMNRGMEKIFSTNRADWKEKYFENFLRTYGMIIDETKSIVRSKSLDKKLLLREIQIDIKENPATLYIFNDVTELSNLEKALGRAEQLALLGKMTASIAHEIKTPIASMKLSVQLLRKQLGNIDPDSGETLDILEKETKRLEERSLQFLTFSKTNFELKPVDLLEVLEEAVKLARIRARERGIKIEFHASQEKMTVNGDENSLSSAFLNVLVNGMDASVENGVIEVKLDKVRTSAVIIFTDRGNGIPPDYMDYVFEPFFTLKSGGTGLGMSIVKRVIDAHGGRIEVKSQEGQGTVILIRIPLLR
jgi:signal transduction histidine kinase